MRPDDKMTNPDHYDNIVCTEIPDPTKYPEMHQLVVQHMMHGPCGHLRPSSPCMQGEPKIYRFRYPREFNDKTSQAENSYQLYRRRNIGRDVNVRGNALYNRWVVPYNPKLLMKFNCHINVEACSSITSMKYLFKSIYKGHDKQVMHIDPDERQNVINEIKRFQDARYVSPPEAMWQIFSFALSQIQPYVMALQIHFLNKQMVRFRDDDIITYIVARESGKRTMLTAFFDRNKEDKSARKHVYKSFPKHYTWNESARRWN
ncbi:uncharacterized protein LOC112515220 [Cynara cardunculus var. scolymus]|uniref:uncharacterized protein LOC112515220 n=1 Tax=Cynara cardunculus var. scolymus TaxID=59895 RepID=UPI000D624DAB|nr:uncharacterized protein LOC112515220 [Cynara cardunculus var. scolymus]